MIIEIKKFGAMLVSRETGREASLASQSLLKGLRESETLEVTVGIKFKISN